jgi:hypothetical protein
MGIGFVFFVLGVLGLAVALGLAAVYNAAKRTPYRTAIRAWLVTLVLELVAWPVLYPLADFAFNLSAHSSWLYLLLLLLSVLPAWVGLQYDRLRRQLPTLFQPAQKPPPQVPFDLVAQVSKIDLKDPPKKGA